MPGFTKQQNVVVEGEVQFPGNYAITSKQEKISDVIKRSGGLTDFSFVEGAVLIRQRKLSEAEQAVKNQKLNALLNQTSDSTSIQKIIEEDQASNRSIVGIDLKHILAKPGSSYDLLLVDGDLISIPQRKQTILVSGEVLYPIRIQYNKSNSFKSYVYGAGGFTIKALKRRGYVIYANGTVKSTKSFLGMRFHPKVKAGSEIVIPPKDERKKLSGVETITILTSLTTMAVLLITLLK